MNTITVTLGKMPLSLRALERAGMDPLVAAHVYNINYGPINRLPDELLLHILRYIGDDPLTILCLRRVARRFRRIINSPEIWKVMRVGLSWRSMPVSESLCLVSERPDGRTSAPNTKRRTMRDGCMLRRPGVLDKRGWLRRYNPDAGWLAGLFAMVVAQLYQGLLSHLHCNGCGSGHDAYRVLSSNSRDPGRIEEHLSVPRLPWGRSFVRACQHFVGRHRTLRFRLAAAAKCPRLPSLP